MQLLCGQNLSKLVDYSFGDHHIFWDTNLIGEVWFANANNHEFLSKAKEFEGRVMTLFIDNIRLYPREIVTEDRDKTFVQLMMRTNNLLALCSLLPKNQFIIFTGEEDTPIDEHIRLPDNVLKIYACNALYNTDRIIPFPIGLQRQIGQNDKRLDIMKLALSEPKHTEPSKLLYINCGVGRNPERLPLLKFESNSWCTTRFDKDSKFFPYERYSEFLSELRDHKFVVCPKGHGYDTHRIWETLYMRRVPVMLSDPYFSRLFRKLGLPVLFINNWGLIDDKWLKDMDMFYDQAQTMDLSKLDLELMYNERKG